MFQVIAVDRNINIRVKSPIFLLHSKFEALFFVAKSVIVLLVVLIGREIAGISFFGLHQAILPQSLVKQVIEVLLVPRIINKTFF